MIRKLYNLYFSPEKEITRELKSILGFTPRNLQLYKQAFFHKSMNNNTSASHNNERLEYLGDAILSTVVAEYLFYKYPAEKEGFLTKMRSKIVKRKTLNDIADRMGLDIILSKFSMGKLSSSMKGNALEALVGAIYIENGYAWTKRYLIYKILTQYLNIHELENFDDNFKSQLLEWGQKENKTIEFKLLSKFKLDKRDRFKIAVCVDRQQIAMAEDFNKKSAEQMASKSALKHLDI